MLQKSGFPELCNTPFLFRAAARHPRGAENRKAPSAAYYGTIGALLTGTPL
ncbi:hypothetical protein EVA_14279 [gut metagenome]|uniref:Uncharacterized protein n=1 Tax=gut metagenome TaxID=749906 RepID=J9GE23_9ZZZZ